MGSLTLQDICLRLVAAFLAGVVIGLERESHGRPAGLRTTILACVASAVAMILSHLLFVGAIAMPGGSNWRPDPARLGAGILTGIGFLGAGTILRQTNVIRGVTTAATLWFVTVVGLTFGAGEYALGGLGTVVGFFTLFVLPRLERHIPNDFYAVLTVTSRIDAFPGNSLIKEIESLGPNVKTIKLSCDVATNQKTVTCDLRILKSQMFELSAKVVADLSGRPGVLAVRWT
jgi:putative Mg2+ transporter-C (MgtC) family protein